MGTRTKRRTYLILTALVVVLHSLCNWLYLGSDLYLQQKDVAAHLKVCTKFLLQSRDVIRDSDSPWGCLAGLASLFHQESLPIEHIWIWPRLVYVVTAPVAALWGLTPRVILFSNSIWLAVLLLSVYFIGTRCANPETGFLSVLAASLFPGTYGLSRNYGLDFPMMAMVALGVYWLIRTEDLSRRYPSVVLGLVAGLGLLVKMQLVIFLCGPFGFAFLRGVLRPSRGGASAGRVVANTALAGLAALVCASPFWWGNIGNIVTVFFKHAAEISEFEGYVDIDPRYLASFILSPQYFAYYIVAAIVYISPPLSALCILLLPVFLCSRFREKAIVILWALVPYGLFTAIEIKYSVFYLPALPAIACVIGAGLASLRKRMVQYLLCAAAFGWGLFHFAQLTFGLGPAPYANCPPYASDSLRRDGYPVWAHPAFPNNLERVAKRFIGHISVRERGNRYVRIGVCEFEYSDRDYLLVDSFEYFMESVNPGVYVYRSHFAPDSFLECMDSFNYLIVLEEGNERGPDFGRFERYFIEGRGAALCVRYLGDAEIFSRLVESYRGYELIDRDLLRPEGISVFLMRKPSFPVGDDTILPATHLVSADVFIAYPWIGVDDRLRRAPTVGDYDVLFPYDVEFPLVPPVRRNPSEPYFARYRVCFDRSGTYSLSIRLMDENAAPPRAAVNGRPIKGGNFDHAPGGAKRIGLFRTGVGEGKLELVGGNVFAPVKELRIIREGG